MRHNNIFEVNNENAQDITDNSYMLLLMEEIVQFKTKNNRSPDDSEIIDMSLMIIEAMDEEKKVYAFNDVHCAYLFAANTIERMMPGTIVDVVVNRGQLLGHDGKALRDINYGKEPIFNINIGRHSLIYLPNPGYASSDYSPVAVLKDKMNSFNDVYVSIRATTNQSAILTGQRI